MIRTIAAGVALALSVATAHAAATYYETDFLTQAAPGAISSGGSGGAFGGLCTPGSTPDCPPLGGGKTAGLLTPNGLISISTTGLGVGNYSLVFTIQGVGAQSDGSIWDFTLVNGNSGVDLGTTTIAPLSTLGSGTISTIVSDTGTFTFGVTDLLEQYIGQTDDLPGVLNGDGLADPLDGGIVDSSFDSSEFALTYAITPAPEPASLTAFVLGVAALCAARRRRRGH
jgi:hypothetical protein